MDIYITGFKLLSLKMGENVCNHDNTHNKVQNGLTNDYKCTNNANIFTSFSHWKKCAVVANKRGGRQQQVRKCDLIFLCYKLFNVKRNSFDKKNLFYVFFKRSQKWVFLVLIFARETVAVFLELFNKPDILQGYYMSRNISLFMIFSTEWCYWLHSCFWALWCHQNFRSLLVRLNWTFASIMRLKQGVSSSHWTKSSVTSWMSIS